MTAFAPPVVLGPADAVAHRAFAHPDHIDGDRAVLCMLARDVGVQATAAGTRPLIRYSPDREAWHRRVVVPRPGALLSSETITVVGFFGRIRDVVDPVVGEHIASLSEALVDAVLETAGVLGYSTHLLADERNYANLVLLSSPVIIERWRQATSHREAAGEWSPRYYEHVRIYRGCVDRMDGAGAVRLESVKYWDYRSEPVWQAVRTLG